MKLYALIKENGVTRRVTALEIQPIVNNAVRSTMLLIIDKIIARKGATYKVMLEDLEEFFGEFLGYLAVPMLKEIMGYKKEAYYVNRQQVLAENYDRMPASDLRKIILNYFVNVDMNGENFDRILKELGEIKLHGFEKDDSCLHKCGDCQNLSPKCCTKAEYIKKNIDEYPFIIDGYQICGTSENGELKMPKFFVGNCLDFERFVDSVSYVSKPKESKKHVVAVAERKVANTFKIDSITRKKPDNNDTVNDSNTEDELFISTIVPWYGGEPEINNPVLNRKRNC